MLARPDHDERDGPVRMKEIRQHVETRTRCAAQEASVVPRFLALDVILGVVNGSRDRVRATERFVGPRAIKVN